MGAIVAINPTDVDFDESARSLTCEEEPELPALNSLREVIGRAVGKMMDDPYWGEITIAYRGRVLRNNEILALYEYMRGKQG